MRLNEYAMVILRFVRASIWKIFSIDDQKKSWFFGYGRIKSERSRVGCLSPIVPGCCFATQKQRTEFI